MSVFRQLQELFFTEPKEPFGKPFQYTETLEFTSDQKWWKRKKKAPAAWATVEGEDDAAQGRRFGQAWMMRGDSNEVRVSRIEPGGLVYPIYNKDDAEDMAVFYGEQDDHKDT